MTIGFAIKTVLEIAAILFVVYGILHEDKFIAFEQRFVKKLKKKIFLYRRRRAVIERRKNSEHLKAVPNTKGSALRYAGRGDVA